MGCNTKLVWFISDKSYRIIDCANQAIDSCADCETCFQTAAYKQEIGVIDDIQICMTGDRIYLTWTCPSCGQPVIEDVLPIDAIDLAEAIKADPLCYTCRCKLAVNS